MMSRLLFLALALPLTLSLQTARAAEAVFPVGSHIGLVPPQGMIASTAFPGFEDRDNKTAIVISQLPGQAYEQFLKSMNAGAINIPGVSNAKRELMLMDGGAAYLVVGDQEAEGVKFRKWLLITRRTIASHNSDAALAFVVTAQVPVEASAIYSEESIRKALGSVTLRATVPVQEVLDQLPFRITERADFAGVRSLIPGRAIMLTESEGPGEMSDDQAFLMISVGAGAPAQTSERGTFATNVLRSIQGYKNLRPTFSETMRIGGQPGHEIRLEGQTVHDEKDVVIVQWMRFAGGSFIRLVGVSPKDKWSEAFARFRAVRDGIDTR